MTKVKTKRPQFTAAAEHNLRVAFENAHEALTTARDLRISKLPIFYKDLQAHGNMIRALEEAICPRVAARLTELERQQKAINEAVVRAAMLNVKFGDRIVALESKPAKPAPPPSEAQLWNTTWAAATALSQEQLGRMIQSLQRVYWKKRLATEK